MRLREWGWSETQFIERDYPDEPIAEFVNWLRTTSAWKENAELVHRRVRKLELILSAYRAAHPATVVATTTTDQNAMLPLETRPLLPENIPPAPDDAGRQAIALTAVDKKARQLAALAKAREVRKAKLAARAVQHQEP